MSDNVMEATLPTSDEEFVKAETNDKNDTKLVIDMERNRPFVEEFKQKLAAINDPEAAAQMEAQFKEMTGMTLDEATIALDKTEKKVISRKLPEGGIETITVSKDYVLQENEALVSETKKDEYMKPSEEETAETHRYDRGANPACQWVDENPFIPESKVEEIEESPEDAELRKQVLERLDNAIANPESLKLSEDEIKLAAQTKIFGDESSFRMLAESLNQDINEIIKGKDDPESRYYKEEDRNEAIKKSLEVKVSLENAVKSMQEITEPGFIQEVFDLKYPEYKERGPASVLEKFSTYLDNRLKQDDGHIYRELTNQKKLDDIMTRGNKEIFSTLETKAGKKFTANDFVVSIYRANLGRFSTYFNKDIKYITIKDCDNILSIFTILFTRFMYKKIVEDMKSRKMQRKYFVGFMFDITYIDSLTPEKRQMLDDAWKNVWDKIFTILSGLEKHVAEKLAQTAKK